VIAPDYVTTALMVEAVQSREGFQPGGWLIAAPILIAVLLFLLWFVPRLQTRGLDNPKDRLTLENEFRKTLAQIVGGAAFLIGIYFSWQQLAIAERGQITEAFGRAIGQLGKAEQTATHLGGIYALARIARDTPSEAWTVMDVLAGLVRDRAPTGKPCDDEEVESDVQAALNAIGHIGYANPGQIDVLRKHVGDLNFNRRTMCGLRLVQVNLSRVHLASAYLRHATFDDARFDGAEMSEIYLEDSTLAGSFAGATITLGHLRAARLGGAHLEGAILRGTDLRDAVLIGAVLTGADLTDAKLNGAHLEGVDLSTVKPGTLTQQQVDVAIMSRDTRLPAQLRRPAR